MVTGTLMAIDQDFKSAVYDLHIFGTTVTAYEAIFALALNLVVSVALTAALRIVGARRAPDETVSDDYEELGEVGAEPACTVPACDRMALRRGRRYPV